MDEGNFEMFKKSESTLWSDELGGAESGGVDSALACIGSPNLSPRPPFTL